MSTITTNMLQLPVVTGLDGSEWIWVVQGGTDKRAQIAQITVGAGESARYITEAGNVTVGDGNTAIFMTQDIPEAVDIILPLAQDKIGNVYVGDALGVSTSFPFRIVVEGGVQTIVGLSEYSLNNNYMSVVLRPIPGVGYAL